MCSLHRSHFERGRQEQPQCRSDGSDKPIGKSSNDPPVADANPDAQSGHAEDLVPNQ